MSDMYAILDKNGDIGGRWDAKQGRLMYAAGVRHWALNPHPLQVWSVMQNGDLLRYDAERTRKLSDKIVEYRNFMAKAGAL